MRQLTAKEYCKLLDPSNYHDGIAPTMDQLMFELAFIVSELSADEFDSYDSDGAYTPYMDEVIHQMNQAPDITVTSTGWDVVLAVPIERGSQDDLTEFSLRRPKGAQLRYKASNRAPKYSREPWLTVDMIMQMADGAIKERDMERMAIGDVVQLVKLLQNHTKALSRA